MSRLPSNPGNKEVSMTTRETLRAVAAVLLVVALTLAVAFALEHFGLLGSGGRSCQLRGDC